MDRKSEKHCNFGQEGWWGQSLWISAALVMRKVIFVGNDMDIMMTVDFDMVYRKRECKKTLHKVWITLDALLWHSSCPNRETDFASTSLHICICQHLMLRQVKQILLPSRVWLIKWLNNGNRGTMWYVELDFSPHSLNRKSFPTQACRSSGGLSFLTVVRSVFAGFAEYLTPSLTIFLRWLLESGRKRHSTLHVSQGQQMPLDTLYVCSRRTFHDTLVPTSRRISEQHERKLFRAWYIPCS